MRYRPPMPLRLLLVEDNPGDADLVREYLDEAPGPAPSMEVAGTLADALGLAEEGEFHACLLDLNLPDSEGLATLESVLAAVPDLPVVVLTGHGDREAGALAVASGAQDFLPKDELDARILGRAVRHARERWQAQEELRAAHAELGATNQLLRTTLDSLDAAVFVVDVESRKVVDCNQAAESIFGYSREELLGRPTGRLHVDDEHFQRFGRELRAVLEKGESTFQCEFRMKRRDGSVFPTDHLVRVLGTHEDRHGHTVSVVHDLTERYEKESRIRFQAALLDQVGQAVIATDAQGAIVYWNRAAEELYGWTSDEVQGRPVSQVTVPEEGRVSAEEIMGTLARGEAWSGDFRVRRKDGSTFPALVNNAPVLDEDGELMGVIGVSSDISDRVRMETQLARTNRALRVVSAGNQAMLWSESEEEVLSEACRIAVEDGGYRFAWIGYAEKDPAQTVRPVASWGHEEGYLDAVEITWGSGERGGGPAGSAVRTRAPSVIRDLASDPAFFPWRDEALERGYRSVLGVPLLSQGECLGVLVVYSDETDAFDVAEVHILSELGADLAHGIQIHRTRRRDRDLQERLQETEKLRAVGQLAGGVAHDFNNYLTVIITLIDLLLDEEGIPEDRLQDLKEMRTAAGNAALLTRQLLTFGRRDLRQPEVLDLNQALDESIVMLNRLLGETIRVQVELEPDLPPVLMDRGQLSQLVMNLAINARDAMPEGGTLTIRTALVLPSEHALEEADGPRVLLSVGDTGTGMDAETRNRIFEPFFSTRERGTGLGLATVYGIVTEAGGEIRVESEPGEGTVFFIQLPPASEEEEQAEPRPEASGDLRGTETILVLEDQPPVRLVIRRILERRGYRILEAGSVAEARRVFAGARGEIDLLLADMRLPDGTGLEAGAFLRDVRPDLPILYASGYPEEEVQSALGRELEGGFIQKPFDPDELVRRVRQTLEP